MVNPSTTLVLLRTVADHEGQWGWYQFERAFPPGWFVDEPPQMRAKDLLDQLARNDLISTTPEDSRGIYRLTEKGQELLRSSVIASLSN